MATRVFSQPTDEKIAIAGVEFPFKALPSGKAVKLLDMQSEGLSLNKLLENVSVNIDSEMSTVEELSVAAKSVFDSRFKIIAFGLNIPEESEDYQKLTKAIDEAGFPEIFWVIDQIFEINGVKRLEKMIQNLASKLENWIPDLRQTVSRSLNRYLENQENLEKLEDRIREVRSTGLTSLSSDSQESPSTSEATTLETASLSTS